MWRCSVLSHKLVHLLLPISLLHHRRSDCFNEWLIEALGLYVATWPALCHSSVAEPAVLSELGKRVRVERGPLSDLMTSGYPNVARRFSRTGITVLADTDRMISTMGNLEYSSTSTTSSSPEGSGLRKSILRFCHASQACQTSALIGSRCGLLFCVY